LAWTGNGFGIAWLEDDQSGTAQIQFATLDAAGALTGGPWAITTAPDAGQPPTKTLHGMVWANSRFGLLWSYDKLTPGDLFYTPLLPNGTRERPDEKIGVHSGGLGPAHLSWNGAQISMVWMQNGIQIRRAVGDGQPLGGPLLVNDAGPVTHPDVASGNVHGVVWRDQRDDGVGEIYFQHFDSNGAAFGSNLAITTPDATLSIRPAIAWDGSGFGVAWEDLQFGAGNHEIMFVKVSSTGSKQTGEQRISNEPSVSGGQRLIWTGSEYGLIWHDEASTEVFLARIDGTSGTKIGSDAKITNSPTTPSTTLGLFWTDVMYRVAWAEAQSGSAAAWLGAVCP
jgi:hypothetical protein